MRADQVVTVLDRLTPVTRVLWVAGGWGVDALVGHQTRPHGDLDLAVDAASLPAVRDALAGFVPTEDWLPVRIELTHPDGRRIDLHPVVLAADGSAVQAGPDGTSFHYPAGCTTTGTIAARAITCLTPAQQLAFRQGYTPRPEDHHDIPLLHDLLDPEPSGADHVLVAVDTALPDPEELPVRLGHHDQAGSDGRPEVRIAPPGADLPGRGVLTDQRHMERPDLRFAEPPDGRDIVRPGTAHRVAPPVGDRSPHQARQSG